MWLRRLVGIAMIISFFGMNGIMVVGLLKDEKHPISPIAATLSNNLKVMPTVSITVNPSAIAAGTTSAITWTTTGNVTTCSASGNWSGDKTPFGAESTGRLSNVGEYTYALTCTNASGKADATAKVTVTAAPPATSKSSTAVSAGSGTSGSTSYCGGRLPCYGPKDVASHSSRGNCWGWNGDRVIDISGFDAAFHQVRTGISSIEVSSVCGKDLGPALSGQASAEGQTRNHNQSTKNNADKNELPYFVGYFDSGKP